MNKSTSVAGCLLAIPLVVLILGVVGYVFQLLWNAVVFGIFHGPLITFWQAIALWFFIGTIASFFRGNSK